ncbi:MAG: hypothetical protein CSA05_01150 [Bacteroidia bacterium]|nr:MAG: hypothetical protein CSA05_01150 [Bacteroidia bacterium]
MAKKKKEDLEAVEEIEAALTKTEIFIEENQRMLFIIVGAIFAVVAIYWGYSKYMDNQNQEAMARMFVAEQYFERDSFQVALNGDGTSPGFIEIINNYGSSKAGNLANYYAGISSLHLGNFDQAIEYLKDFDSDDSMVSSIALCGIGDAYMQKENLKDAASYYMKAASKNENNFVTPMALLKAGMAYEELGEYHKAVEVYQDIKNNFKRSTEARKIDKYITQAKMKQKNKN